MYQANYLRLLATSAYLVRMAHLGTAIRTMRQGAGLSLRTLAEMSGTSYAYLSQVERGQRIPSERWLRDVNETLAAHLVVEREAS